MTTVIFRDRDSLWRAAEKEKNQEKKGGQDTSRTPFSLKTSCFQLHGAGASVGERAARKEKASNFNAPNGTIARFGRKTALR
ncbi:hypothetical protein [Sphingobium aquiterrae]|uniref:hypothetical protein n=1 Tax=Sphingobium aquiterrae TaxID=2038656 RepID=UPI003016E552